MTADFPMWKIDCACLQEHASKIRSDSDHLTKVKSTTCLVWFRVRNDRALGPTLVERRSHIRPWVAPAATSLPPEPGGRRWAARSRSACWPRSRPRSASSRDYPPAASPPPTQPPGAACPSSSAQGCNHIQGRINRISCPWRAINGAVAAVAQGRDRQLAEATLSERLSKFLHLMPLINAASEWFISTHFQKSHPQAM